MRVRVFADWFAVVVAASIGLLGSSLAQAQTGTVGTPIAVCVKRVDANNAADGATALLARPRGFDCATEQRAFGPGDYWVMSGPIGVGKNWPARIRIASLWQESASLWALYADGAVRMLPGDGQATSRRIQLGAIVEYRLPVRGVPVVRLLWRVEGAANMRGLLLAARSASQTQSAYSSIVLASLYAGFAGLCLALLLYNLALFGAPRHRFQLAYCVMVAGLMR